MLTFLGFFFNWLYLFFHGILDYISWDYNGQTVTLGSFIIVLSIILFVSGLFFRRS